MTPNLLIFLKVNFSPELNAFEETLIQDEGFTIFKGYETGPCEKEKGVNGMTMVPKSRGYDYDALNEAPTSLSSRQAQSPKKEEGPVPAGVD